MQQQAVLDRRQASVRQGESHAPRNSTSRPSTELAPTVEKTPEEVEYEDMFNSISKAMAQGEYENAVIQWLQTQREQEFFKKYFCQYNPDFIRDLSPLLLLSLGATVSMDFEDELIHQRIAWMETIIASFLSHYNAGTLEQQVRDLIPKIMGIYIQRIEHLFMRISQISANDPVLKRLSLMVSTANRILDGERHRAGL